ncbi:GNAT family N-acetyltransferase [Pseudonocardia lacus]|uniref:GNAT family N-acetyltransferase n=1 Tax=Pseudonocardia lacus TaxID=2835865 RepID=UPI001BDC4835|nr:GNAT family N-acetyltransferase [Pseudonocardia lacus]
MTPVLPATPVLIRPAVMSDLTQVVALIAEAARWIRQLDPGLAQWQTDDCWRRNWVHLDIVAGTLWVIEDAGRVVATITVDEWADADFWKPEDDVLSAFYCHRMAVTRSHAGRGLGSAMLDWASRLAEGAGRPLLRFDAWSTNHALHQYYKGLGFEMVRNEPLEWRGSGALFQRRSAVRLDDPPVLCRSRTAPLDWQVAA